MQEFNQVKGIPWVINRRRRVKFQRLFTEQWPMKPKLIPVLHPLNKRRVPPSPYLPLQESNDGGGRGGWLACT